LRPHHHVRLEEHAVAAAVQLHAELVDHLVVIIPVHIVEKIAGLEPGFQRAAVADAAVSVVATTVKVGAKVVETTVDVTAAGVKAVAGTSESKEKE